MLPILVDFLIIGLVYFLPFIFFMYKLKYDYQIIKYSSFKSIVATIGYIALVLWLPAMHANSLPFLAVLIMIFYMRKENDDDYYRYNFSLKNTSFFIALQYSLVGYFISILASTIGFLLLTFIGIEPKQQDVVQVLSEFSMLNFLISVPTTVIFAPILEEFVFRYILFEKFFNKFLNPIISAIITSLIFAFIHFSLTAFLTLFALSLVTCYAMHKKGYWYAVFVHMLMNFITTFALFISKLIS